MASISMDSYLTKAFASKFPITNHANRNIISNGTSISSNNTTTAIHNSTGNNNNNNNNNILGNISIRNAVSAPEVSTNHNNDNNDISNSTANTTTTTTNSNNNNTSGVDIHHAPKAKRPSISMPDITNSQSTNNTNNTYNYPINTSTSTTTTSPLSTTVNTTNSSNNHEISLFMHHDIHSDLHNILILFNGQRPVKTILNMLPLPYIRNSYGMDIIIWLIRYVIGNNGSMKHLFYIILILIYYACVHVY